MSGSDAPTRRGLPVLGSALATVLLAVVVVAALYLAREVLVPVSLALLLSFVLAPLVRLLRACYAPRVVAVVLAVLLAFAAIFGLGAMMVAQVNQLAGDLPGYQTTLRDKIQRLRGAAAGTGTLERASEVLQDLGRELDKPNRGGASSLSALLGGRPAANKPPPAGVKQPGPPGPPTLVGLLFPPIQP